MDNIGCKYCECSDFKEGLVTETWLIELGAKGKGLSDWDGLVLYHPSGINGHPTLKFELSDCATKANEPSRYVITVKVGGVVEVLRNPTRKQVLDLCNALGHILG